MTRAPKPPRQLKEDPAPADAEVNLDQLGAQLAAFAHHHRGLQISGLPTVGLGALSAAMEALAERLQETPPAKPRTAAKKQTSRRKKAR